MAFLSGIEQLVTFLVVLSILVVVHEWGHFIVARLFGIRVDDFSIGFGKRLARLGKRGDTEYNLRMLPLGGFVKIAGMEADEEPLLRARDKVQEAVQGKRADSDPDAKEIPLLAENLPESVPYTAPDGFNSKPLWQRSFVILAGPVMSLVLGYVVLCLIGVTIGLPTGNALNRVGEVEPGGEGQRIGLQAGDVIKSINNQPITDGSQMVGLIHDSLGKPLTLIVQRGEQTMTKTATPRPWLNDNGKPILVVDVTSPGVLSGALGLKPGDTLDAINDTPIENAGQALQMLRGSVGKRVDVDIERNQESATLHGKIPAGAANSLPALNDHEVGVLKFSPALEIRRVGLKESLLRGNIFMGRFFMGLVQLIRQGQLHKQTGSIISIYHQTGLAVKEGPFDTVMLLAQLSISLAIFNLLPIPILDGGHLLSFFIEWARRGKKMTPQQQQAFLMAGLAIIGVLFVLVISKDIVRAFTHQLPQ